MSHSMIKDALTLTEPNIWVKDKSKATAYHESGHAVIMLLYGFVPESATINQDGSIGGAVSGINNADMASHHYLLEDDIDVSAIFCFNYSLELSFAGVIAESFVTGEYNWEGFNTDSGSILHEYIAAYGVSDRETVIDAEVLQRTWDAVHNHIADNFDLVSEIADDLYKLKSLITDDFDTFKKYELFGSLKPS